MEFMPLPMLAAFAFIFGTIIGSFSAVLVCRMRTGASLNTRSHCLSCGHTLSWYELVPVASYLALRARCRICDAKIPRRDFIIETLTGLLYAVIVLAVPDLIEAAFIALFATVLIIASAYDLRHLIIPDELVAAAVGSAMLLVGYRAFAANDLSVVPETLAAGALAFLAYAALWFAGKGRWIGFGDAKLAFPLGMALGLSGIFSMVVLSFWVGAAVSVGVLLWSRYGGQHGLRFQGAPLRMKSEVPFAPFLVIAFALVLLFEIDVLSLTSYVLG